MGGMRLHVERTRRDVLRLMEQGGCSDTTVREASARLSSLQCLLLADEAQRDPHRGLGHDAEPKAEAVCASIMADVVTATLASPIMEVEIRRLQEENDALREQLFTIMRDMHAAATEAASLRGEKDRTARAMEYALKRLFQEVLGLRMKSFSGTGALFDYEGYIQLQSSEESEMKAKYEDLEKQFNDYVRRAEEEKDAIVAKWRGKLAAAEQREKQAHARLGFLTDTFGRGLTYMRYHLHDVRSRAFELKQDVEEQRGYVLGGLEDMRHHLVTADANASVLVDYCRNVCDVIMMRIETENQRQKTSDIAKRLAALLAPKKDDSTAKKRAKHFWKKQPLTTNFANVVDVVNKHYDETDRQIEEAKDEVKLVQLEKQKIMSERKRDSVAPPNMGQQQQQQPSRPRPAPLNEVASHKEPTPVPPPPPPAPLPSTRSPVKFVPPAQTEVGSSYNAKLMPYLASAVANPSFDVPQDVRTTIRIAVECHRASLKLRLRLAGRYALATVQQDRFLAWYTEQPLATQADEDRHAYITEGVEVLCAKRLERLQQQERACSANMKAQVASLWAGFPNEVQQLIRLAMSTTEVAQGQGRRGKDKPKAQVRAMAPRKPNAPAFHRYRLNDSAKSEELFVGIRGSLQSSGARRSLAGSALSQPPTGTSPSSNSGSDPGGRWSRPTSSDTKGIATAATRSTRLYIEPDLADDLNLLKVQSAAPASKISLPSTTMSTSTRVGQQSRKLLVDNAKPLKADLSELLSHSHRKINSARPAPLHR